MPETTTPTPAADSPQVRIADELYDQARVAAAVAKVSTTAWINRAVAEALAETEAAPAA